jgi:hypothetical protein
LAGGGIIMSRATTIEIAGKGVGIIVEDERGLSFFADTAAYAVLEGLNFARLRDVERAMRALKDSDTSRKRAKALQRWRSPYTQDSRAA